ncbi:MULTISPECIES: hypothetical protein [unclassified Pseudomonas]|uniref:hypothetical protein n=1 Tax=unclassified Pseudomonas TaxID=196821 RepID=UPI0004802B7A|nr:MULTISPECIES: hypothetical protein [unclassified Pseudomonas]RAS31743.1 hypothetical protein H040_01033 [Pseudomonas sp. URMO17WK12:I7]SMF58310.1 hypothetical protein SAMN02745903_04396 [Pseudomonas sp. URMO17WK12:I5]
MLLAVLVLLNARCLSGRSSFSPQPLKRASIAIPLQIPHSHISSGLPLAVARVRLFTHWKWSAPLA